MESNWRSSPLLLYSSRKVIQEAASIEIIEDHYVLQMVSSPSIEPSLIKLMGARVATTT
jgi:hypothetical protein